MTCSCKTAAHDPGCPDSTIQTICGAVPSFSFPSGEAPELLTALDLIAKALAERDEARANATKLIEENHDAVARWELCGEKLREAEAQAAVACLVIAAFAKDDAIKCHCGEPPYEDGEPCPKCTAIRSADVVKSGRALLAELAALRKVAEAAGRLEGRRGPLRPGEPGDLHDIIIEDARLWEELQKALSELEKIKG